MASLQARLPCTSPTSRPHLAHTSPAPRPHLAHISPTSPRHLPAISLQASSAMGFLRSEAREAAVYFSYSHLPEGAPPPRVAAELDTSPRSPPHLHHVSAISPPHLPRWATSSTSSTRRSRAAARRWEPSPSPSPSPSPPPSPPHPTQVYVGQVDAFMAIQEAYTEGDNGTK